MSSEFVCRFCQAELPAYVANDTCPECGCSIDLADNNSVIDSPDKSNEPSHSFSSNPSDSQRVGSVGNLTGSDIGDFRLLEPIAKRGMGVVYRAQEKSRDRFVALMVIDPKALSSQAEFDRLEIELRSAIELEHSNIVPTYDVGNSEGWRYVSQGLVEGQSLADKVADRPLGANAAAESLFSICEAIEFAHQRGVFHRDLNLHNILEDSKGELRVVDFGLARQPNWKDEQADEEAERSNVSTFGSMAPEQARIRTNESGAEAGWNDVTEAVDIYGLGAILFSMLTSSQPLEGESSNQTLTKVIEQEPMRLSRMVSAPNDLADLETICMKCLEKDPAERYPSVSALKKELGRFIAGDPIDAKPHGVWGKVQLWRRMIARNPDLRLHSATTIAGFPLVSIAFGRNRDRTEQSGHAKGLVALGDRATGLVAYGGFARGAVAIGRITIGLVSVGFLSVGVLSIGLAALGVWTVGAVAIGYGALGLIALGYKCIGLFSLGYKAVGAFSKGFASLLGIAS